MKVEQAATDVASSDKAVKNADKAVAKDANKQTLRPVFKVQILSTSSELPAGSSKLKGVKASYYKENGLYKYTTGDTEDYNEILRVKRRLEQKFTGAFIVAFQGGKKMDVQKAIREFKNQK